MIIRKPRYDPEPLFLLYFDYEGDIHAMLTDKRCSIKNYPNLYYFCKRHEFKKRMDEIHETARRHNDEEMVKALVIYKKHLLAMCKQIFVNYSKRVVEGDMRVTMSDFLVAWKIYKRETGEFFGQT